MKAAYLAGMLSVLMACAQNANQGDNQAALQAEVKMMYGDVEIAEVFTTGDGVEISVQSAGQEYKAHFSDGQWRYTSHEVDRLLVPTKLLEDIERLYPDASILSIEIRELPAQEIQYVMNCSEGMLGYALIVDQEGMVLEQLSML